MRRAEWRMRAGDPTTAFGWWWRLFAASSAPVLVSFVVSMAAFAFGGTVGFLTLFILPLAAILSQAFLLRDDGSRLRGILPDPAPPGQFIARAAYRRSGLTTGTDEMALVVVDGWLVAEGVRSQFSLRASDVARFRTHRDRTDSLLLEDGSEIRLWGLRDDARVALERWDRQVGRAKGVPEFPPLGAHPREIARWIGWAFAGVACLVTGIFVVPLLVPKGPAHLFAIAAVLGVSGGVLKLADKRLDRLRELTRMEREALSGQASPLRERVEGRTLEDARAEARDTLAG